MLLSMFAPTFAVPPQQVGAYDPSRSFAPLVEAMAPGVVLVRTKTRTQNGADQHSGSGFIMDEKGWVLTAYHVVQGVETLKVKLFDGRQVPATVLGYDAAMDIALLRLEGNRSDWPWLKLGRSADVRVGDRVLAMGNPLGLGATVTAGIVSGTGRDLDLDKYYGSDDFIQTDAAINQGNSGGPLIDLDGRVVGMNTSIIAGANTVGFSVPADVLRRVVPQLHDHGRVLRGFLGLDSKKLTPAAAAKLGAERGAIVVVVQPGSAAEAGGVQLGDVIIGVEDAPISSASDLLRAIGNRAPDEVVRLTVIRKRQQRVLTITLGARPKE